MPPRTARASLFSTAPAFRSRDCAPWVWRGRLRRPGEDRQLPDRGDRRVVDRGPAWMLGATLYLPESWLTPAQRGRARIPAACTRATEVAARADAAAAGAGERDHLTAVLGDAEFGESATLRRTLHRAQLPYALGVSSTLTFVGTPTVVAPAPGAGLGRPRSRRTLAPDVGVLEARAWAAAQPARAWRVVSWRNAHTRLAGAVLCDARHARARLARPPTRARGLAPLRTRPRRARSDQVLSRPPASDRVAAHSGATPAPALGDRAAVSGTEGRTRSRSFRGTLPARMAAPRRAHRPRVRLAPMRTPTTGRSPAHASTRARRDHRDSHGPFLRDATALLAHHAETGRN